MHKWNHSKDTGSEQDSNNKVAVNRANYAAKNPELLTSIWGFICKEAEWYLQGFWWQGSISFSNTHVNDACFQICNTR